MSLWKEIESAETKFSGAHHAMAAPPGAELFFEITDLPKSVNFAKFEFNKIFRLVTS